MNKETVEAIQGLAESLGQPTQTLIGYFAQQAPYKFTAPIFAGLFVLAALGCAIRCWQLDKRGEGEPGMIIAGLIVSLLAMAIALIVMLVELHQAILAWASPQAYAVERILYLL